MKATHIALAAALSSAAFTQTAEARTYYVVALGDSMTSGEGAPDVRANRNGGVAQWFEDALCHRSRNNYAARAVEAIRAQIGPNHDIVFKNFACSGAEIIEGIVSDQLKRLSDGARVPVRPQLDQVEDWMQAQGIRSVDAVIMTIGINDIQFGGLVTECLSPHHTACTKTFQSTLPAYFSVLETGYRSILRTHLERRLSPEHVFVMEYPDPLRDAAGRFCDRYDDGYHQLAGGPLYLGNFRMPVLGWVGNISSAETRASFDGVLEPLNLRIRQHVALNDRNSSSTTWTFVDGTLTETRRHGYCARQSRYFNTLRDSNLKQGDLNGALHPNDTGHRALADLLASRVMSTMTFDAQWWWMLNRR